MRNTLKTLLTLLNEQSSETTVNLVRDNGRVLKMRTMDAKDATNHTTGVVCTWSI